MPAYVIVDIDIHDRAAYEAGNLGAIDTVSAHGGKYLVRGGETEVLEGDWDPRRIVILQFETMDQARAWYESPEYAPAKRLRHQVARTNMLLVEGN
jgi:uncharacterized protein (DUF1330 family)